jgi:predicted nucleic acid-binding protein
MEKKQYVIDASVFAKLVLLEDDSIRAEQLITTIISDQHYMLFPSIFVYELIAVLQKNDIETAIISQFVATNLQGLHIKIIELDHNIISKSLEITKWGSIKSGYPSFYDASYHAIAMLNDCDFITADRKHYEKTKHLGHIKLLEQA